MSLLETLAAAASQMAPADKARPTAGPPPLLFLQHALAPADHLKPQHLNLFLAKTPADSATGIYTPLVLCLLPPVNDDMREGMQTVLGQRLNQEFPTPLCWPCLQTMMDTCQGGSHV